MMAGRERRGRHDLRQAGVQDAGRHRDQRRVRRRDQHPAQLPHPGARFRAARARAEGAGRDQPAGPHPRPRLRPARHRPRAYRRPREGTHRRPGGGLDAPEPPGHHPGTLRRPLVAGMRRSLRRPQQHRVHRRVQRHDGRPGDRDPHGLRLLGHRRGLRPRRLHVLRHGAGEALRRAALPHAPHLDPREAAQLWRHHVDHLSDPRARRRAALRPHAYRDLRSEGAEPRLRRRPGARPRRRDRHRYEAIGREEYDAIRAAVEAGTYEYRVEEGTFDCAGYVDRLAETGEPAEKRDPESTWGPA